jgi:ABC-type nitrate/sulfonate/bicarbonate transport system substrate-binding protein
MSLRHLFLGAALLCAPFAIAQTQSPATTTPAPACPGTVTIVRVSEVKPGQLDAFMAAVAAHQAWYRANGVTTNKIYAARILEEDSNGKPAGFSDTKIMTFHINPPHDGKLPRNDDAWKAYVQKYRDSSDLKTEYVTCSPTPMS